MVASRPNGPVADFCAALRQLQVTSGLSRSVLARRLNYGRSQLYDILDGRIKRPPEWDRFVEPYVRACMAGHGDVERAVADWRTRHEVLVRVHEELGRHGPRLAEGTGAPGAGPDLPATRDLPASQALQANSARLWPRLAAHPFVRSVGAGTLGDDAFRRWMANDHYWNVEYQRFILALAGIAPNDAITESIGIATSDTRLGLREIRRLAGRYAVDLGAEPSPATVGLAAYLQAQVSRGYESAIVAFYAAERAYFDTWSAIEPDADHTTPYWPLIECWCSRSYGIWLGSLGRMVDAALPAGPGPELYRVFDWVVRFELLFFESLHTGAAW